MRKFINIVEGEAFPFRAASEELWRQLPMAGGNMVRSYVRMEAGFEPYGPPLANEDTLVRDWCRRKVEEVYYERFASRIASGKIEAWREITAARDWQPDHWEHVGNYWCWKEGCAEAYWGKPGHHEGAGEWRFLIHAYLPVEHIDWISTLVMNANPDYEDEYEVRINRGSPVKIISVKGLGKA